MNSNQFQKALQKIFPWIKKLDFEKIEKYKNYLQNENKKYNLTRLDKEESIYGSYFYESVFVYENLLENKKQKIIDVGSGSGIPGIVLAIIFSLTNITIIESSNKKCAFMNNLVNKLNLKNVVIINSRVEKLNLNLREKFDVATSRALAPLKISCELLTPYLKIKGILIQPKSILIKEELEKAKFIIDKLNLRFLKINNLNFEGKTHQVICFQKIKGTSSIYPRTWKEIIKDE